MNEKNSIKRLFFLFLKTIVSFGILIFVFDLLRSNYYLLKNLSTLPSYFNSILMNCKIIHFRHFFFIFKSWGLLALLCLNCYCLGDIICLILKKHMPDHLEFTLGVIFYPVLMFILCSVFHFSHLVFQISSFTPFFLRLFLLLLNFLNIKQLKNIEIPRFKLHDNAPRIFIQFIQKNIFFITVLFIISMILFLFSNSYPFDYDGLEYHLGAPLEFWKNHNISFLPHNIYANMPSLSSMLNLFFIAFDGGDHCKVIQAFFILLSGLMIFQHSKNTAGFLGAIFFLTCPEILFSSFSVKNEPLILWFVFCAFRVIKYSFHKNKYFICGILLGAAAATKYSSIVLFVPLFLILIALHKKDTSKFKRCFHLFSGILLVLSPWLIRNFQTTGNPLYPFFQDIFSFFVTQKHFTALQFGSIHFSDTLSLKSFAQAFQSLFSGFESNRLWIISVLFLFFTPFKKKYFELCIFIIGGSFLWFFLTHHLERFMKPFIPFQILLFIFLILKNKRIKIPLIAIFFLHLLFNGLIILSFIEKSEILHLTFGLQSKTSFLNRYLSEYPMYNYMKTRILPHETVLYIGEAKIYYRNWNIIYNTPYTPPLWAKYFKKTELKTEILQQDQIHYILFHLSELNRVRIRYADTVTLDNLNIMTELDKKLTLIKTNDNKMIRLYQVSTQTLNR